MKVDIEKLIQMAFSWLKIKTYPLGQFNKKENSVIS
jgi:hypothetical protein